MKRTQRFCDFCGGKVEDKKQMARLSVPMTPEETALKARTKAKAGAADGDPDDVASSPFSIYLFGGRPEAQTHEYDMTLRKVLGDV